MVGRTWKDLRPGAPREAGGGAPRASAFGAGAPQRPEPGAVLAGVPQLGRLLEQRSDLEARMENLLAGPGATVDPREAARFPVMGLPERRAEHRRWEDQRANSAADALAARRASREAPPPARERRDSSPGDSPYARIAGWFAERDEAGEAASDRARRRRDDEVGVQERLDRRVAAGRARVDAARRGERAARRSEARGAGDEGSRPGAQGVRREGPEREVADGRRRPRQGPDLEAWPRDRWSADGERRGRQGGDGEPERPWPRVSSREAPERAPAEPARVPGRQAPTSRDQARERSRGRQASATAGLDDLGQRAERARERLLGRRSRLRQAARAAARAGDRAQAMADQLKGLDRKLADAGMDSERRALKDSSVGKLTRALDRTAELARKPQRMVERANGQWERRRDQIAGVLPVDPGYRERVKRLLDVDVGSIESFEDRMNRTRDRALRRRDAQRREEQREQARRERARERSLERRREEERET